jgi:hypothetical protein
MLIFSPTKRVTAQESLKHYWLDMPADFEYTMNEKEYSRMMMIKQNNKKEKVEDGPKADVIESDSDINMGDDEDNSEFNTDDELDDLFEDGQNNDYTDDQFIIPNYNNSFAAYGQFVSLSSLDRANPQFDNLK